MNKKNSSLIKEFAISLLIVICLILIFSIIFYNKISLTKVVPQTETYMISDEMQKDIDKLSENEDSEVITTYYLDAADLKTYEKTKEYNKGRKDPFAQVSSSSSSSNNNKNDSNSNQSNSNKEKNNINNENEETKSNSTNFYEDDGTK